MSLLFSPRIESEGVSWERNLGAVSDGPRWERGAKKFSHPESRTGKPVRPKLLFPCKVA